MDFSKIDFNYECFIDIHVEGYGSLSGLFFCGKNDLIVLADFFKTSHDWKPSFERDGKQYVKGFIDAGNVKFNQFMQNLTLKEKEQQDEFYQEHGFPMQTSDFCEIWNDNDISDVQISFPMIDKKDLIK